MDYPKEIEVAAEWWTDLLRKGADWDNGEPLHNALDSMLNKKSSTPLSEEHLKVFKDHLSQTLLSQIIDSIDSWRPSEPIWGSSNRGVCIDYHAPAFLMNAAVAAGIKVSGTTTFGCKTCMHVNPGSVKVSQGYGAEWKVVWEGEPTSVEQMQEPEQYRFGRIAMSRNKQIDKLRAGLDELRIPAGGIMPNDPPNDPVDRALAMLTRDIILIDKLQEERNAAVAKYVKINNMWREARARFNVSQKELYQMRQGMVEIEMAKTSNRFGSNDMAEKPRIVINGKWYEVGQQETTPRDGQEALGLNGSGVMRREGSSTGCLSTHTLTPCDPPKAYTLGEELLASVEEEYRSRAVHFRRSIAGEIALASAPRGWSYIAHTCVSEAPRIILSPPVPEPKTDRAVLEEVIAAWDGDQSLFAALKLAEKHLAAQSDTPAQPKLKG